MHERISTLTWTRRSRINHEVTEKVTRITKIIRITLIYMCMFEFVLINSFGTAIVVSVLSFG